MPRNEDGEFELILGNKQLLSVFFIVVILLGVFFTMGYIVGRNSSPLAADSRRPEKPAIIDSGNRPTPAGNVIAPADTPMQAPGEPPTVKPAEPPVIAPEPKPEPPPKVVEKTPEKAPEKAPEKKAAERKEKEKPVEKAEKPSKTASPTPNQPVTGAKYLQVAAVAKSEAQIFVDVLSKKGFPAIYAQHPDQPQTFRVLVGPFKDAAAIAKAREDLEKTGIPGRKALVRNF